MIEGFFPFFDNFGNESGMNRRKTGLRGEKEASLFLINDGFAIIKRNFRTRNGEIDIIAKQDNTLIFIEVKTSNVYSEDSLE